MSGCTPAVSPQPPFSMAAPLLLMGDLFQLDGSDTVTGHLDRIRGLVIKQGCSYADGIFSLQYKEGLQFSFEREDRKTLS